MKASVCMYFLFLVLVACGSILFAHASVAEQARESLISAAIEDVLSGNDNRQHTEMDHEGKGGKLFNSFKHASEKAIKQGRARVMFEKIVHEAELNIMKSENKQAFEHSAGSVLTKEEVEIIYRATECEEHFADCSQPGILEFRTISGVCNNPGRPLLGSSDTPFRRIIEAQYEDGLNQIQGTRQSMATGEGPFLPLFPSSRTISSRVVEDKEEFSVQHTHILMQWGQFLDHDLDLTPAFILDPPCSGCDVTEQCVPIRVAMNDPTFGEESQPMTCLAFPRSIPVCDHGAQQGRVSPRQQINELTSFIDGSQIYGSTEAVFNAVREEQTAFLRTGPNIPANGGASLVVDTDGLVECMQDRPCFLAGDVRVNEQLSLTIMHTVWMREHNRIAEELSQICPDADQEKIFQTARAIVGAELQKITYTEYLPIILGDLHSVLIPPYTGYKPNVDPSIPNAFATAAFRFGHSQINPFFNRLDENNQPLDIGSLSLIDAFFNPQQYALSGGTDPILRGLLVNNVRKVDEFLNDILTNHLFQSNASIGLDLASLNIQRGRDHGLPPYLTWKRWAEEECGIASEFTNDFTTFQLQRAYGTLNAVDLWIGGLAERNVPGGQVGATFACIIANAFLSVRDGDRFFYKNPQSLFNEEQIRAIENTSLSRIICDNSDGIVRIQTNAFQADQELVDCSSLPNIDLNLWKDAL